MAHVERSTLLQATYVHIGIESKVIIHLEIKLSFFFTFWLFRSFLFPYKLSTVLYNVVRIKLNSEWSGVRFRGVLRIKNKIKSICYPFVLYENKVFWPL